MKQSVTVGAQLLWSGRYGCNNGRYGCTIVMSYIEINKAVSQWLLTFNLCVSVTWPLTCAFHIPCTHTPEIIDMHRGMCDKPCENLWLCYVSVKWVNVFCQPFLLGEVVVSTSNSSLQKLPILETNIQSVTWLDVLLLRINFRKLSMLIFNSSPLVPHICASELGQHWFR